MEEITARETNSKTDIKLFLTFLECSLASLGSCNRGTITSTPQEKCSSSTQVLFVFQSLNMRRQSVGAKGLTGKEACIVRSFRGLKDLKL